MKKNNIFKFILIGGYFLFIVYSFLFNFPEGQKISLNFYKFTKNLISILPCSFILIGLFEVWVKKDLIEKHLGPKCGILGYLWAILLAGTTIGGIIVAFPVAYSLHNKGARLSIIFTYISSSAICRVPMTIFEASFMGLKFSLIRLLVSLPLVIITSILLEKYLLRENYKINKGL